MSCNEEEEKIEAEIKQYKEQLASIKALIESNADVSQDELNNLKTDLEQLINLSEETLLELKKKNLLSQLDKYETTLNATTSSKSEAKTEIDLNDDIVASKCRVYFECSNTHLKMHNALVLGIDSYEENTVRVLFCNPTQTNMKICQHFMNGTCRFENNCKYSHGHKVKVENLETYLEPKFDNLKIGMSCLAKHTDELWHLARVESVDKEHICVQFKRFNLATALDWSSVFLLDNNSELSDDELNDSNEESDLDESDLSLDEEDENDEAENLPTTSANLSFACLGDWEKHTKGIGSKLMAKMGYIAGKGLGKSGEGRVEPVEVTVLPEGNISLDKAMQLKNNKLNRKIKKQKLKKKLFEKKENEKEEEETDVFNFINNKLAIKKPKEQTNDICTKSESLPKNTKGLNIKMLETHNQIQDTEKVIQKLKESLIRNKNADKETLSQIRQKLTANEQIMEKLRKSEAEINKEKKNIKKKIDIF